MEEDKCQFEYEGKKCTCTDVVGIARCKYFCKIHFNTIRSDNIRRFNKGESIPEELVFTKKLTNGESAPRFLTLKNEKEVK
jgi:hypothetical protein